MVVKYYAVAPFVPSTGSLLKFTSSFIVVIVTATPLLTYSMGLPNASAVSMAKEDEVFNDLGLVRALIVTIIEV